MPERFRSRLFQFGSDEEFARGIVILDAQNIRLAADPTVLDVRLAASGGIHRGDVPLATRSTLETAFHE